MYDAFMNEQRSVIADRIEELLRRQDITVAQLSRVSGVSESSISNILSGHRKQPRSDTVQKLAKGFGTSIGYLNGETDDPEPENAPPLPDYAAEVIEAMRKLDKVHNYELLLLARTFVEKSESIRNVAQSEIIDLLLDIGDEVAGVEETDRAMKILELLEKKRGSRVPLFLNDAK